MMKYLPENRPDHTCNRAVPEPPAMVAGRPALGVAVPVTAQKNLDRPGGEARPSMQSGGAATVAGSAERRNVPGDPALPAYRGRSRRWRCGRHGNEVLTRL